MKLYDADPIVNATKKRVTFAFRNRKKDQYNTLFGGALGEIRLCDDYTSYIWTSRLFNIGDFEIIIIGDKCEIEVGAFIRKIYDKEEGVDAAWLSSFGFSSDTEGGVETGIVESIERETDENGQTKHIIRGRLAEKILADRITGRILKLHGGALSVMQQLIKAVFFGEREEKQTRNNLLKEPKDYNKYVRGIASVNDTELPTNLGYSHGDFRPNFKIHLKEDSFYDYVSSERDYQFTGDNLYKEIIKLGATVGIFPKVTTNNSFESNNPQYDTDSTELIIEFALVGSNGTQYLTDDNISDVKILIDEKEKVSSCLVAFDGEEDERNMVWVDFNLLDQNVFEFDNNARTELEGVNSGLPYALDRVERFIDRRDIAVAELDGYEKERTAYELARKIALEELNIGIKGVTFNLDTTKGDFIHSYPLGTCVMFNNSKIIPSHLPNNYVITEYIESINENGVYTLIPTLEIKGVYKIA